MTLPLALLAALAATVGLLAFGIGDGFGGFASFVEGHGEFRIVPWLSIASLALAGARNLGGLGRLRSGDDLAVESHRAISQTAPCPG